MSSYFDKIFYQRYPKLKFNDRIIFIKTSDSDVKSDGSKTDTSDTEGTIFMNNVNINDSFDNIDVGVSEVDLDDYPTNKKKSRLVLQKKI